MFSVRNSMSCTTTSWSLGKKDHSFLPAFRTGRESYPLIRLLNSRVLVMDTSLGISCMPLIVTVPMDCRVLTQTRSLLIPEYPLACFIRLPVAIFHPISVFVGVSTLGP